MTERNARAMPETLDIEQIDTAVGGPLSAIVPGVPRTPAERFCIRSTTGASAMKVFACALAASTLSLTLPTVAEATTYFGTRTVASATAHLVITTDGTLGVLGTANITDWTISVSQGDYSFVLLGPLSGNNSDVTVFGSAFSATATDLLFNFSAAAGVVLFQAPPIGVPSLGPTYCVGVTGCFADTAGEFVYAGAGLGAVNQQSGSVVLATARGAGPGPVPEPATWAMMLLGFGLVGTGVRRHQKMTARFSF